MNVLQLEFDLEDKSPLEIKMDYMQKEFIDMQKSMEKVRKKLFSEMTEVKKENLLLRKMVEERVYERLKWAYGQGDCLFDVSNA